MKNILFTLCFCTAILTATAQRHDSFKSSWIPKWNPEGILIGKIGLLGEYNFRPKRSVTFGIGIPVLRSDLALSSDGDKIPVSGKTFSVLAGYRCYLGKETASGVYVEPYLQYLTNQAFTRYPVDHASGTSTYEYTNNYHSLGVGCELGAQFLINHHFDIDLFLIGPELNRVSNHGALHDVTSVGPWTQAESSNAETEVKNRLNTVPVIGSYIDHRTNFTGDAANRTIFANFKGALPSFRAGLSFGYRF